ncbi:MAG: DUF481 domain-containing protein [Thermodesulfobacteriota bacterium]
MFHPLFTMIALRTYLAKPLLFLFPLVISGLFASGVQATEEEAPRWASSITLGLNLNKGNSETTLVKASVEAHRKDPKHDIRLKGEMNYGTAEVENSDGTKDTEVNVQNIQGTASLRRFLSRQAYRYINLKALQDKIADLDYRAVLGAGAGYYLLRSDTVELSLEAGPSYVAEEVDNNRDGYFAGRAAQRFEYQFTEASRVWETLEYLTSLRNTEDFLLNGELGAEAALNSRLALRVVLQDSYDNTPASGKEENDLVLTAGVTYRF